VANTAERGAAEPLVVQFDDNRLLRALFGDYDSHVARIESRLGVSVSSRGNRVAISGSPPSQQAAKAVFEGLYARLRCGHEVAAGEVEGAIRMAEQSGREDKAGAEAVIRTRLGLVVPRSPTQTDYVRLLGSHDVVFAIGPAGTGKTFLAVAQAVSLLLRGEVDRIVLSRPAVEAGERLGFLPGDMREKVDPYLRPLYDALHQMLAADQVAKRIDNGQIEIAPVAFMRGRTLAQSFVILDEAQNTTAGQMKMLLTRMGEGSRMAVTGDLTQIDLPVGTTSGLQDAVNLLEGTPGIAVVRFTERDIVRHPVVTRIIRAYDARERGAAPAGAPPTAKE